MNLNLEQFEKVIDNENIDIGSKLMHDSPNRLIINDYKKEIFLQIKIGAHFDMSPFLTNDVIKTLATIGHDFRALVIGDVFDGNFLRIDFNNEDDELFFKLRHL